METTPITLDRDVARSLYRKYREHLHYSTPIDHEIMRAYQLIAQGRLIIKALESITTAGVGEDGLPKLAIARATAEKCFLRHASPDGSCEMSCSGKWSRSNERFGNRFQFARGSFPAFKKWNAEAILPPVPLHLRPARGLANYHVLWEAQWTRTPPADPYLLRRIGIGDMWLVVAMWNLTPVERAALQARL